MTALLIIAIIGLGVTIVVGGIAVGRMIAKESKIRKETFLK